LLQGKVDAILAGADFQGVQIADQGKQINEIFYKDVGVPTVGLSLVVNEDTMKKEPDKLSKFVAASLKGWDAARKNPSAAAQAVADQFPAAGQADQFRKQLEVDSKVLCGPGAKSLGTVPTANWNKTYDLLTKYQNLPASSPINDYYTTQFLPKDPPKC
jgi:NitT/TauT family transport system substrate-binding protein